MKRESAALDAGCVRESEFIPPHLELDAIRAHPLFPAAIRACAAEMVRLQGRSRFLGWFLSDRTLAILAHIAICLDADASDDDPRSGLTPGRFKSFCVQNGMCSEGRATAILAFMRLTGHFEPEIHPADRRITRLRPSLKLLETMRSRLRAQFAGTVLVCPEIAAAADSLGRREFEQALGLEFLRRYTAGARIIHPTARGVRLFAERDAGLLILLALMLGADPSEPLPPAGPVPLSIAALARRFRVSRTHVLRLIREAESAGLLSRLGEKGELISLGPELQDELRHLFAATFQLAALCAAPGLKSRRS